METTTRTLVPNHYRYELWRDPQMGLVMVDHESCSAYYPSPAPTMTALIRTMSPLFGPQNNYRLHLQNQAQRRLLAGTHDGVEYRLSQDGVGRDALRFVFGPPGVSPERIATIQGLLKEFHDSKSETE